MIRKGQDDTWKPTKFKRRDMEPGDELQQSWGFKKGRLRHVQAAASLGLRGKRPKISLGGNGRFQSRAFSGF